MEISPRYDGPPAIQLDGDPAAIATPLHRQRARFADVLRTLTDEQWAAPSRCDAWSIQDVVSHLAGANEFWALSMQSGLAGEPTRFLVGFDPTSTPAALVDAARGDTPAATLERFVASSRAIDTAVEGLDSAGWSTLAEAPPGHVTLSAVGYHALWDSWVHERDVLLPLGLQPDEEPDEVLAGLRYAAALSPAFAAQADAARNGALVLDVDEPEATIVVEVDGDVVRVHDGPIPEGALVLTGRAVDLLEALSVRAPLEQTIPDDQAWLLAGLRQVFESAET